ncbi:Coatomer subunit beta [Nosema bombycis CQ1]|uniref:Coatomer subunit beta n=1 Tax=Nosema bombycis (strain CQ1 / CVCC 102059) TaxID=578461 RepID=R0MKS9_NOSB1|nr:Coatomer subunit beta [Nosema bombycis CQ1]|eukprot:EOB14840.1 Coatomer subunit beta [Nosema bombycis CQ1]
MRDFPLHPPLPPFVSIIYSNFIFLTLKMLKTSLYANLNSEISKEKILQLIGSQETENKLKGMKELISQISQGKSYTSITHNVIKDVLSSPSNELKRFFYYFLEISLPFMAESELLLLSNQIRKDLDHPNEFVRGTVLRFVSRMESIDILLNFHKPILENFNHPIAFVRRNAYFCLGHVSSRLGIFEDTAEHLMAALNRDTDPNCLCQAFSSLYSLEPNLAIEFAYQINNSKCKELSLCMIEKVKETDFLLHFLVDEDPVVRMEASLTLTDVTTDEYILEKSAGIIIDNLKVNKSYLSPALTKLLKISSFVDVSKFSLPVLELIDPYDLEASRSILDFVISVSATQDFMSILNFICRKSHAYSKTTTLKSNGINILLLEKLSLFVSKYSIFSSEVVDLGIEGSKSKNPAVSYEALQVIKNLFPSLKNEQAYTEKILDHLISLLSSVHFGKIFREVLEIVAGNGDGQHLKNAISIFRNSLNLKNEKNVPLWLQKENIFLISFISICLTEMFYKIEENKEDLLVDLLALLLLFFRHVKDNDLCSTETIVSCIRRLRSPVIESPSNAESQRSVPKAGVCDPLDFKFLRIREDEKITMLGKFLDSREQTESISKVHQLTGLSDPIYVECNVIYSRFEIVLDILMINQTDSYLQNMLFDFGSSPNLKPSYVSTPENMKARSAVSRKLVFKVLDSSNGFINGSVTFKYPSATGEYANRVYTLNFSEIKTCVSDFLEPKSISSEDFREMWRKMEWENVYSVKISSNSTLSDILNVFKRKLKGNIVDCKDNEDFLVGNISATTKQNNDILFNVCMTKDGQFINLECRVRSSKEEVVKSLNDILNEVVKLNKSL